MRIIEKVTQSNSYKNKIILFLSKKYQIVLPELLSESTKKFI